MEKKLYRPNEFAKIVGMTKRALRYYYQKGILIPEYINSEGYTYYSEQNLFEAQQISTLRYLQFSIDDIRIIQSKQKDISSSLNLQKKLLNEKVLEMQRLIDAIDIMEISLSREVKIPWDNMFEIVKSTKRASIEDSMIKYYDERASEYDQIFSGGGPASCKPEIYKMDLTKLFLFISSYGGNNVIDIACGTGFWLQSYYKKCNNFTFLDISSQMLDKCKEKVESLKISNKSLFVQNDFLNWNNETKKQYNFAIAGFILGHFTTIQEAQFFSQIRKIMKSGSKLLIIDNTWSKWRAADEHKEDIEKRHLLDGREFSIYKKYFEEQEIKNILEKYQIKVIDTCWGHNFFGIIGEII